MNSTATCTASDKPANKADTRSSGLACPKCGCRHLPVVYTRPRDNGILRARQCRHCGKRIITRERI